MPKVSVIVPIYGVEKYIERCVKSLFAQTLDDLEFIFIDDCTPDRSMELLDAEIEKKRPRFAEMNWKVRTVRMPTNSGQAAVRRHGIQLATGKYIIHCDSDDWVEKTAYEKLYRCAIDNDYDIVYCDYYKSDGINRTYFKKTENERFMTGPLWNKLVKSSLYKNEINYPVNNKAEDGAIMMQLSFYAKTRGYINEPLYYYFFNPESICNVPTIEACLERHRQECANLNLRLDFLKNKGVTDEYKDSIVAWKLAARKNLLPLVKEEKYYQQWLNTYPEINGRIMTCPAVKIKSKVGYLMVKYRLYPFICKLLS